MISAKVCKICQNEGISMIKFACNEQKISMLCLENLGLEVGQKVRIGFKSSDVIIAKSPILDCSLNNEIKAQILNSNIGEIIACLHLKAQNFEFESLISASSYQRLNLSVGDEIYAYVKSTSIFISSFDDKN